jgi:signal transduction histidine kinase
MISTDECGEASDTQLVIAELGRKMTLLWKLMNELVDWASVEDSEEDFIPDHHSAADLIGELREFMADEADKKGLALTATARQGLTIYGDRRMISAVLRNLTANAIKFTDRGGQVSVSAAAADGGTELCVRDTGIGMEESTVRAFMAAGEIKSRRGTEGELGSGLGLRLCRRLIERHRGTLKIESALDVGTTFTVFFPSRGESSVEVLADHAVGDRSMVALRARAGHGRGPSGPTGNFRTLNPQTPSVAD